MAAAAYFYPPVKYSEPEREALILEHIPQVRLIARKIHERVPCSVCFDDLFSAGVVGLINAIDHFDSRQNVKLKTYAEFRIRGAILDSLRQTDWAPRLKRRQARDFEAAASRLQQRLGRFPEEAEIAAELKLSIEAYHEKVTEMEALNIGEMEYKRDENGFPVVLKYAALRYASTSTEESPAMALERAELEKLIAASLDRIPAVEKTVLNLYFYEELTLREIAGIMGIHLSRVSQIKSQAIPRLRTVITKHWPGVQAC